MALFCSFTEIGAVWALWFQWCSPSQTWSTTDPCSVDKVKVRCLGLRLRCLGLNPGKKKQNKTHSFLWWELSGCTFGKGKQPYWGQWWVRNWTCSPCFAVTEQQQVHCEVHSCCLCLVWVSLWSSSGTFFLQAVLTPLGLQGAPFMHAQAGRKEKTPGWGRSFTLQPGSQLMFSKKELDWWPHLPLTCPLGASSLSPQILIVKGRDPLIFFLCTLQPSWRGQKYHLSLNTCPSKLNLFITAKNVYFLFFTKYVFSAFGEKWS